VGGDIATLLFIDPEIIIFFINCGMQTKVQGFMATIFHYMTILHSIIISNL